MNNLKAYNCPWYECVGPTPEEVRVDMLTNFKWFNLNNFPDCFTNPNVIKKLILEVIPDSRDDFGSHRGYSTFFRHEIYIEIDNKLKEYMIEKFKEKYAWKKLKKHFLPLIIHKLYSPGGIRYKKCENHFYLLSNS